MNKRFIATALTGLVAVGLAACSPPNEQPSDQKVDTADSQPTDSVDQGSDWTTGEASAPSSPAATSSAATGTATAAAAVEEIAFVDCVAEPTTEPTQVTLDCANPADAVVGIEWASWGEDEAQGSGTNQTTGAAAEVTLSAPEESAQGSLYTVITVDGAQVTQ